MQTISRHNKTRITAHAALALALIASFSGCGGGSQLTLQNAASRSTKGAVTITVHWPPRTPLTGRLIPDQSNCITVLFGANGVYPPILLQRPGVTTANLTITTPVTSVKVDNLPVGTQTVTATAYPNASGTGVAQASASSSVTVITNQTVPLNLAMKTTITKIIVASGSGSAASPTIDLPAGSTEKVTATAQDVDSNVVLTDPTKWTWKSSAPGVCTIKPSQESAMLTAGTTGSTTMTVTETESMVDAVVTIAVASGATWSQFLGNAQNSYATAGPAASGALVARTVVPSSNFVSNPLVLEDPTDGIQFIGGDGVWYRMSSAGAMNKMFSISTNNLYGQPAINAIGPDGTLYGLSGSAIQALTPTGDVKWTKPLISSAGAQGQYSLTLSTDGVLYCPSGNGNNQLSAINAATGNTIWTKTVPQFITSKPAIGLSGAVFVVYPSIYQGSSISAGVSALDPHTGVILWSATLQYNPYGASQPYQIGVASSGEVIVQTENSTQALNPASGAILWVVPAYSEVGQRLVLTSSGTVVTTTSTGHVPYGIQGLDASTGAVRWQIFDVVNSTNYLAAGAAADGTVYIETSQFLSVGKSQTTINAIDGNTGVQKWSIPLNYPLFSNQGDVLAIGKDGKLYTMDYNGTQPVIGSPEIDIIR